MISQVPKKTKAPSLSTGYEVRTAASYSVIAGFVTFDMGVAFMQGHITIEELLDEADRNKQIKRFLRKRATFTPSIRLIR